MSGLWRGFARRSPPPPTRAPLLAGRVHRAPLSFSAFLPAAARGRCAGPAARHGRGFPGTLKPVRSCSCGHSSLNAALSFRIPSSPVLSGFFLLLSVLLDLRYFPLTPHFPCGHSFFFCSFSGYTGNVHTHNEVWMRVVPAPGAAHAAMTVGRFCPAWALAPGGRLCPFSSRQRQRCPHLRPKMCAPPSPD